MNEETQLIIGLALVFCLFIAFLIPGVIEAGKREKAEFESEKERVLKTKILDLIHETKSSTHTSTGSAVGRAVVGGAVAGPLGAAVGASTAKTDTNSTSKWTKTTFLIIYKDGSHTTQTVANGNKWYKLYMEKLEVY